MGPPDNSVTHVLVCGGREYLDYRKLKETLDALHEDTPIQVIIQGGARGADAMAAKWARAAKIALTTFHANWNKYGKSAGAIRNQQMLDIGKPDLVLAFPGGRGTADMAKRAGAYGVKLRVVK